MKLVALEFLKLAPGGKFNAGEIGGCPEAEAERLIKAGIAKLYEPKPGPKAEPEPAPKKKPKGLEHLDRAMNSPETKRG